MPSWLAVVTPAAIWPFRPATRTMKNSSRFESEIDRKRSRSSNGWFGLAASSSTRMLKASHDSSRFTNRCGDWRLTLTTSANCADMTVLRLRRGPCFSGLRALVQE